MAADTIDGDIGHRTLLGSGARIGAKAKIPPLPRRITGYDGTVISAGSPLVIALITSSPSVRISLKAGFVATFRVDR
jgi:hypothetical protein